MKNEVLDKTGDEKFCEAVRFILTFCFLFAFLVMPLVLGFCGFILKVKSVEFYELLSKIFYGTLAAMVLLAVFASPCAVSSKK